MQGTHARGQLLPLQQLSTYLRGVDMKMHLQAAGSNLSGQLLERLLLAHPVHLHWLAAVD
jgi:hypothetical protein